ncbi:cell division protein FtsK [Microlunatus sp. GCM10028923]|uniref:cell division protein FtsK n=1 Tax=Microlunatus sp. GCM10028923 TaxID=3273400 RepID=UPI0036239F5F
MTATTQHDPYGDHADQDDRDGRDGVIPFPGTAWPAYDPDDEQHDDHDDPDQDDTADQDDNGDQDELDQDRDDRDGDDDRDGSDRDGGVLVVRDRGELVPAGDASRVGDGGEVQFVDPDPATLAQVLPRWRQAEDRPPVIPVWLRDRQTRWEACVWAARAARHVTAFHAARVPVYGARLLARSPRGAYRLVRDWRLWVLDIESRPLVLSAIRAEDAEMHLKLTEKRVNRMRTRGLLSGMGVIAVTGVAAFGIVTAIVPVPVMLLIAAVVIGLLGKVGTDRDKPVISRALASKKIPILTSDLVLTALGALGIADLNRALKTPGADQRMFPDPIARDKQGWRATIDLPYGVTAQEVIQKRQTLAAALRRPVNCVWPDADPSVHPGRLILWVGDTDIATAEKTPGPLAKLARTDIFTPIPFGLDPRGREVSLTLMFNSMLIGSMPRYGKTSSLLGIVLAAALDPYVILDVFELKGTGDLGPAEPVCHTYVSGLATGDDNDPTLAAVMVRLRELVAELGKRSERISRLPADLCPERKITPAIARRPELGLQPILVILDECQELFESEKFGEEAAYLCKRLTKIGPAMGIIFVPATQKPDANSLPTGVSSNAGIRYCLRVMGHTENDMILGSGMNKAGVKATEFTEADKGVGILRGHGPRIETVKAYFFDAKTAAPVIERARALREEAGTLTGHAIGETTEVAGPTFSLLDDLAAVWPSGVDKVWSEVLCDGLTKLRPDHYRGLDPAGLTGQLKPYGIETKQVWGTDPHTGKGTSRRGPHRADLDQARRELKRKRQTETDGSGD